LELEHIQADARMVDQQKRLLRDMHDGLGGISANISLLANLGLQETEIEAKNGVLEKIETLAAEGNAEIRSLMNAMEHRELVWTDWLLEIRKVGQATCAGRALEFASSIEGAPPETSLSLLAGMSMFRMIKEAITNAVKHAEASRLELRLRFLAQGFEAVVQDNGRGFDPAAVRTGRGLANLRKRAAELGGEMSFAGENGTRCRFWIPLPIKYPVEALDSSVAHLPE
jgi:signal transduction histidine kinase